ncbi:MAG: hypothetical protein QCH35_02740 [Methanomicrobiaceae archaeon]|nr:hypothetical protein [Methanomicrobiaceae archaeon]
MRSAVLGFVVLCALCVLVSGVSAHGCPPSPHLCKVTGGGTVYVCEEVATIPCVDGNGECLKVTIGFNAQPDKKDGVKGHVTIVFHDGSGTKVQEKVTSLLCDCDLKTATMQWGDSDYLFVKDEGEGPGIDVITLRIDGTVYEQVGDEYNDNVQFHYCK